MRIPLHIRNKQMQFIGEKTHGLGIKNHEVGRCAKLFNILFPQYTGSLSPPLCHISWCING